jgi:hypothetical protein
VSPVEVGAAVAAFLAGTGPGVAAGGDPARGGPEGAPSCPPGYTPVPGLFLAGLWGTAGLGASFGGAQAVDFAKA